MKRLFRFTEGFDFRLREGEPGAEGSGAGLLGSAFAKANAGNEPPKPPEGTPPPEFTPNPMWQHLETQYQVKPPDGLTAENEMQAIEEVFLQRAQANVQQPELHPVVAELNQQFQNPEFKYDDWLTAQTSRQQMMQKTGKDFYAEFLKMEYEGQVTDERVNQIIEGMSESDLALKELEAKKVLSQRQKDEQAINQQRMNEQRSEAISRETKRIDQELTDLFGRTKNVKEIYGVEISEAEVDTFNQTFKELVTPDPNTGEMAISRLLQSNDDLWRFAFIAINGDQKLKEALFNAKEGTKNAVFNQLKRTPSTSGNQPATPVSGNKITPSKWTQPSQ